MATAKLTPAAEITDIQRRMAQIRRELHEEVKEAVKGAQSLTDWRSQVKNHPWIALGAAAMVGYVIVPKRRKPESPMLMTVSEPATAQAAVVPAAAIPARTRRVGILGPAFGLLAPIAIRAAQNYAIQFLEQWMTAQQNGPDLAGTGASAGSGPGPGAKPRPADGIRGTRPTAPFGNPGRPGDNR